LTFERESVLANGIFLKKSMVDYSSQLGRLVQMDVGRFPDFLSQWFLKWWSSDQGVRGRSTELWSPARETVNKNLVAAK